MKVLRTDFSHRVRPLVTVCGVSFIHCILDMGCLERDCKKNPFLFHLPQAGIATHSLLRYGEKRLSESEREPVREGTHL